MVVSLSEGGWGDKAASGVVGEGVGTQSAQRGVIIMK